MTAGPAWLTGPPPAQSQPQPTYEQPPPGYGAPPPGYGYGPPPTMQQQQSTVPLYDGAANARVTRDHPEYGEVRRWRFTTKQFVGIVAALLLIGIMIGSIFTALAFVRFIDAINAVVDTIFIAGPILRVNG